MVTEAEFNKAIDVWIDDFRAEAVRQFAAGCNPMDVVRIAQQVADSKANRRAMERAARSAEFRAAFQRSQN